MAPLVVRRCLLLGTAGFLLDRRVDLFAMDGDFAGSLDAKPHAVTANLDDGNHDLVSDHDAFVTMS